ncbi:MAG: cupin domain-containing protein [Deltaproteobacteria bacterium]|nr:cupin domain-containing protein [Deltaproteobacteria bacterium]
MEKFRKISDATRFAPEKMQKNNLFKTERMYCDLYCFEPGQVQAPHVHEESDKIYFVVDGRGLFQIGEDEMELGAEEIAIAPSGQKHGVSNRGPERLVLLVFMAPKPAHG